jgi:hypothetical protein
MLAVLTRDAPATDRVWNSQSSGNWSVGGNWSPIGSPANGDRVFAMTISPQQIVINYDDETNNKMYSSILIDENGPGSMRLSQMANTLSASALTIGGGGVATYSAGGSAIGSFGTLNLSTNGRLTMSGNAEVDGVFFNQNGPVFATGGTIIAGVYTQNGAFDTTGSGSTITALVSTSDFIANNPSFGGSLRLYDNLMLNVGTLGIAGDFRSLMPSYTLPADRTIGVGQDVFLDTGTFTQFGTFASSPGGSVHAPGSNTFIKGGASWIVQGGSNTGGFFYLGSGGTGIATYTLNGSGTCNFTLMEIASAVSAAFNQNGGYVVTNGLTVGAGTVGASSGTYSISAGSLNAMFGATIGVDGAASGAIKQTGGRVNIGGPLTINENANSRGEYTKSGGTLNVVGRTLSHGSFTQSAGVATFNANYDGSGTLSITGGTMNVTRLRQRAITIGGTGLMQEVESVAQSSFTHRAESLSFESGPNNSVKGTWDIGGSDLVIDYSGPSPIASIQRYIASGRANGAWTGTGIRSAVAAADPTHVLALGSAEASQALGPNGGFFKDLAVDSSAVLVKLTLVGDTDLNGRINFDDYVHADNGFNNHLAGWFNGDFDYNGVVNFDDYVLIDLAFNTQRGTLGRALSFLDGSDHSSEGMSDLALRRVEQHVVAFGSSYASHFLAAVPEPTGITLTGMALALMPRRRRR